jgi:O-antigen ligase
LCLALAAGLTALPGATHGERWSKLWERPEEVGGTAGDLMALWRHSLREIAKHPFTGIGLGRHSFSLAYPEFRATHQPLLWHAHNMFLDIGLQLGLQGLLALLAIMTVLVTTLWPRAALTSGDDVRIFGAAVAVMVVGFCVRNLADDFFVKDSALLFWLLAGLALGAGCWRKESAKGGAAASLPGRGRPGGAA